MKKLLLMTIAAMIFTGCSDFISYIKNSVVVNFPDKNLERIIRNEIDKPSGDIYWSDVEGIKEVDATYIIIEDLTGIQYLTSLTALYAPESKISDINPVANLTSLTHLLLKRNRISDISALTRLASLKSLDLWENNISDINSLADLTSLIFLNLGTNNIVRPYSKRYLA